MCFPNVTNDFILVGFHIVTAPISAAELFGLQREEKTGLLDGIYGN